MKNTAHKTETPAWMEALTEATSDLQEGRVDGFKSFLYDHAPELTYKEVVLVRDKLITKVRHKTDHILRGAALKAHAARISSLFEELQDIISIKRHYHSIEMRRRHEDWEAKKLKPLYSEPKTKKLKLDSTELVAGKTQNPRSAQRLKKQVGRRVGRPHLRLVPKPFQEISGERQSHTVKGIEVDLIVGSTKKDVCIFQIVRMSGKLPKVNAGSVYSINALPPVLEEYFYPERTAKKQAEKAEQIAIKLEANRSKKKNKGDKKGRKASKAKKAA